MDAERAVRGWGAGGGGRAGRDPPELGRGPGSSGGGAEAHQAPSSVFIFFPFLPCKDNQVYVKCVCSFDSLRYLINSITPNSIVPKVFEMRWGPCLSSPVNHC